MYFLIDGLILFMALTVVLSYPAGLIAIESRQIKDHQFRMLMGTIALGVIVCFYTINLIVPLRDYTGLYRGAYTLSYWLTLGLGVSGLLLSILAIWAMLETAWDLHRRAGMFGMLSGTVSGLSVLINLTLTYF